VRNMIVWMVPIFSERVTGGSVMGVIGLGRAVGES